MNNLYEAFHKCFEVVIADTPELLEKAYRIRYQVLCVEKRLPGFDQSLYSDGQEKDNYDSHSSHALLRHRPSGSFIGTVRLILFDELNPEKLLPVEKYGQIDSKLCNLDILPRHQTAEISRFVVVSQFNRRKSERCNLEKRKGNVIEVRDRRSTPHLALVLMAGVLRMSANHNIKNWVSVMDPVLNRLLSYFGLGFSIIGPVIDYHGLRRPYFMNVNNVLAEMEKSHHDAWEVMTDNGKYSQFLTD